MKEKFREVRLSKANKQRLELVNSILEEYANEGYVMTLRQLYYQLVTKAIIPNKKSEYMKLSNLIKEGRLGGIVDWSSIEDRLRTPKIPYYNESIKEAVKDALRQFRLDRQLNQWNYVEVWVEKDALSAVLSRVTSQYHIPLLVNRGYGSITAMYNAANRIRHQIIAKNKQTYTILYLGDHDPSGMDMIRDVKTRIRELLDVREMEYLEAAFEFKVIPIALTTEQVQQYNPPENPAKITDPRASWYIEKFGTKSWELDALEPRVLHSILDNAIKEQIDMSLFKEMMGEEETEKAKLKKFIDTF